MAINIRININQGRNNIKVSILPLLLLLVIIILVMVLVFFVCMIMPWEIQLWCLVIRCREIESTLLISKGTKIKNIWMGILGKLKSMRWERQMTKITTIENSQKSLVTFVKEPMQSTITTKMLKLPNQMNLPSQKSFQRTIRNMSMNHPPFVYSCPNFGCQTKTYPCNSKCNYCV